MHSVARMSWSDLGGVGVIQEFPNRRCFVVLQTDEIHDQIEAFLAELTSSVLSAD